MNKKNIIIVAVILIIILIVIVGAQLLLKDRFKGSAYLSWQPNKETNLAGYRIYYGASPRTGDCPPGGYEKTIETGTASSYTIGDLDNNKVYYFSITSFNTANKESCFSAEVSKNISLSLKEKWNQLISSLVNF